MQRRIRFLVLLLLTGLFGTCLSSKGQAADRVVVIPMAGAKTLQNVVTVAKANGKFSDPIAAINSISDASEANPYLILIGPGQYTLTGAMVMKPYVDVSGSGEGVTVLTGEISSATGFLTDLSFITGANHSTLSNLSIRNTGVNAEANGVYYPSGCDKTARLERVSITVTGGTSNNYGVYSQFSSPTLSGVTVDVGSMVSSTMNYGIYNSFAFPAMTDITATASGGSMSYGVYNFHASPTMTQVDASGKSGLDKNYGIYNNSESSPTMTLINALGRSGTSSYGIYNISSSNPTMISVNATASSGTYGYGVVNNGSSPTMTEVNATASGSTSSYGVYNFNTSTVKIRRSTLTGDSNGLYLGGSDAVTLSQSTIIHGYAGEADKHA